MTPELTSWQVDATERGHVSRLSEKSTTEKVCLKSCQKKVRERRSVGEDPRENVCWIRFAGEGLPEKQRKETKLESH